MTIALPDTGEILLEQDIGGGVGDRLIGETSDILVGEDDSLIIQENTEEVGFHIATESRDQFGISFDDGSILLDGVCNLIDKVNSGYGTLKCPSSTTNGQREKIATVLSLRLDGIRWRE